MLFIVEDQIKPVPNLIKYFYVQAAKALEMMRMTPSDEQELLVLSQLPDTARIVRTLFIDSQKGVLPWDTVVEKVTFSSKHTRSKGKFTYLLALALCHF